jgi:hypothetical protein
VKALWIAFALCIAVPAAAQEKLPPKKKPAPKAVGHKKATPEQIRKFNELEKKKRQ